MYSLPPGFDSTYLTGKQLECTCFLQYQVNLYFSDNLCLQIEGQFRFEDSSGESDKETSFPLRVSALPSVVGEGIKSVDFDRGSGNISLVFESGAVLHLEGDSGPFESYRLFSRDDTIIV